MKVLHSDREQEKKPEEKIESPAVETVKEEKKPSVSFTPQPGTKINVIIIIIVVLVILAVIVGAVIFFRNRNKQTDAVNR